MLDAPQLDRTLGISFGVDKDVNQKQEPVKSGHLTGERHELGFKDVRWLQLFIQTFFLTSLFLFRNI